MATKQLQSKTKPQQLLHQSQHNSKPPSSSTSSKSSSETSTMPSNNNMTTNINSNSCATSIAITQHTQDVVTIERYNSVLATLDGEVRARQHVEAQLNEARLRIQYLERQLSNTTVVYHQSQPNPLPQPQPQPQTQPQTQPQLHHPLVLVNNNNNNNIVNEQTKQQQQPKVEEVRPQPQPTSQSQESKQSQDKEILSHCSDISNCNKGSTSNNGNGSADGGNDTFHNNNNNNNNNTTNSSSQSKKLVNNNNNSGVTKKSSKSKKDRPVKIKIPGQSRYWTPEEHKLFLEALQKYGHKDLRSISNYVGTRNMTQVRTHSQKYFMRLMREAKRQNPNGNTTNVMTDSNKTLLSSSSMAEVQQQAPEPQPKAEQVTDTNIRNTSTTSNDKCASIPNNNMNRITSFNNNNIRSSIDESDKYSVPNTCGMTLLCLVGEDTRV